MEIILIILLCLCLLLLSVLLLQQNKQNTYMRQKLNDLNHRNDLFNNMQKEIYSMQSQHLGQLQQSLNASLNQLEQRFQTFELSNEQKLEGIRLTLEKKLTYLQEDQNRQLDQIRHTVDEKLQTTLEEKMTQSFQLVNERLETVYKGLGEMRTLANGVGDLKKVLSNVKTRGILGEIQLGAILEEILSPEQYETNFATIPGSKNVVEYAIKLPGDEHPVYLPIDSKFPIDAYMALQEAYESQDQEAIHQAKTAFIQRIKGFARDIKTKYVEPPYTTDFAIMFLPFEGLYAEVIKLGLVESLQRDYHINIAGPTTMAALLNSLQMGFKTIALQKRSSEVWEILGAVKTEFDKFADILVMTQQRLDQAHRELDKLVGVRTRAIQRKLRHVEKLDDYHSQQILENDDE